VGPRAIKDLRRFVRGAVDDSKISLVVLAGPEIAVLQSLSSLHRQVLAAVPGGTAGDVEWV